MPSWALNCVTVVSCVVLNGTLPLLGRHYGCIIPRGCKHVMYPDKAEWLEGLFFEETENHAPPGSYNLPRYFYLDRLL